MIKSLLDSFGRGYARSLGLDLTKEEGVFGWFLASLLFGAPIRERAAICTYKFFVQEGITTPEGIQAAGWDKLVACLDRGGYTRYDFKTADKLLAVAQRLISEYTGSLIQLRDMATTPKDLELRLKALGKGVGDTTVAIFLRELRGRWDLANPDMHHFAATAAERFGLPPTLTGLREMWGERGVEGYDFVDLEDALTRLGRDYCTKGRCDRCPLGDQCVSRGMP